MKGNTYGLGYVFSEEKKEKMSVSRIGKKKNIKNRTSDFIGVNFSKNSKKWIARIRVNKKSIVIGYFKDELEAAIKYNEASIFYYGDTMPLNDV